MPNLAPSSILSLIDYQLAVSIVGSKNKNMLL